MAAVGPLAVPPPNTYAREPMAVAPASWTAAGSAPPTRGRPGATRTTPATDASAASRPPAASRVRAARASPGSWTGAGRARTRITRRAMLGARRERAAPRGVAGAARPAPRSVVRTGAGRCEPQPAAIVAIRAAAATAVSRRSPPRHGEDEAGGRGIGTRTLAPDA